VDDEVVPWLAFPFGDAAEPLAVPVFEDPFWDVALVDGVAAVPPFGFMFVDAGCPVVFGLAFVKGACPLGAEVPGPAGAVVFENPPCCGVKPVNGVLDVPPLGLPFAKGMGPFGKIPGLMNPVAVLPGNPP